MGLSKSKYTKGVYCPKVCWCELHEPDRYDDSVLNQSVLKTGNEVGDVAMGYFGDFVEVPFSRDFRHMAQETRALMERGERVICEATFEFESSVCLVDILVVEEDGVELYEVKSSTHVREVYHHDVAYQCWVLSQCGLVVKRACLMHLNGAYVRQGELDLHELFTVEDVTEEALARHDEVARNVADLKAYVAQPEEPREKPGMHCFEPYECGFRAWCWRDEPTPNVFDIGGLGPKKACKLRESGIMTFQDALDADVKLSKRQRKQVEAVLGGKSRSVDEAEVAAFLDTLTFPLYFLDFETFQFAIPEYEGTKVYQQIPFQYSLHVVEGPEDEPRHVEFLAREGIDPRRALAERLVADIPADACVLAYNMNFEKGVLSSLAQAFPDLADVLLAIRENMRDLMIPFRDGHFYDAAMGGSYSIKRVLPALCGGDPELDYATLEGVHNGVEAMDAFKHLASCAPEEIARVRAELLAYCRLDTLAMVRIWQHMRQGEVCHGG